MKLEYKDLLFGAVVLLVLNIVYFMQYTSAPGKPVPPPQSDVSLTTLSPAQFRVEVVAEKEHVKCERVLDVGLRIECYHRFGLEPLVDCENENKSGRSICYNKNVKEFGDTSVCEVLDARERDKCYHVAAVDELDPKHCENVFDPYRKLVCVAALAAFANDSSLCSGWHDVNWLGPSYSYLPPSWIRDACYTSVAVTSYNSAACDAVGDADFKVYCRALEEGNFSVCRNLGSEFRRSKCFGDVISSSERRIRPHPDMPFRSDMPYIVVFTSREENGLLRYW